MVKIRIQKIDPSAKLPSFAYDGDGGMDIFSCEECILSPGEIKAVGTDLKIAIPEGYAGFVWDKSGLALEGLTTLAGVLDSGYRGEVKVVLLNVGRKPYHIKKHQKIAQLVIQKVERPEITEEVLDDSERGERGFGSTGII